LAGPDGGQVHAMVLDRDDERWWRRGARGALAGAVATVAMSAVQFPGAARAAQLPPPVELTRRLHRAAGRRPDRGELFARGTALHLAFGAACGALCALVAPRRRRELTGLGFAGAVYASSYLAFLPALGLHPHGTDDDDRRQAANVVGHAVYGLVLAEALRLTDPRPAGGASSR
jgi:hypothetical protein